MIKSTTAGVGIEQAEMVVRRYVDDVNREARAKGVKVIPRQPQQFTHPPMLYVGQVHNYHVGPCHSGGFAVSIYCYGPTGRVNEHFSNVMPPDMDPWDWIKVQMVKKRLTE